MKTKFITTLLAAAFISQPAYAGSSAPVTITDTNGYTVTAKDKAKLKKLMRAHVWYGGGVSRGVRAAAGDPNMPVVDRRVVWGETYTCSFFTMQGRRSILCQ
ncbi:MAG: hypothetical protein ACR2O8_10540 [Rhizobiaceae bacterium]